MANKARGEIRFSVGESEFELAPSFKAICEMEERLECGAFEIAQKISKGQLSAKHMAAIIYSGLLGAGKEKPIEEVGEIVMGLGLAKSLEISVKFVAECLSPGGELVGGGSSGKSQTK